MNDIISEMQKHLKRLKTKRLLNMMHSSINATAHGYEGNKGWDILSTLYKEQLLTGRSWSKAINI